MEDEARWIVLQALAQGGRRSSGARLLVGERLERSEAVSRRMPEEPPVMRMVLFLREIRAEGSTVKVAILGLCVCALRNLCCRIEIVRGSCA